MSKYDRFIAKGVDLSDWALSDEELAQEQARRKFKAHAAKQRKQRLHAPGIRFVRGTIPFPVLGQAWRLCHAALPVLLAIKSETDLQRWRTGEDDIEVAVTAALCAQLAVSRDQRLRALRALEAAGMISVTWADRSAPRVRLAPGLFDEGKLEVRR
jgi:hypothetical protein